MPHVLWLQCLRLWSSYVSYMIETIYLTCGLLVTLRHVKMLQWALRNHMNERNKTFDPFTFLPALEENTGVVHLCAPFIFKWYVFELREASKKTLLIKLTDRLRLLWLAFICPQRMTFCHKGWKLTLSTSVRSQSEMRYLWCDIY